MWAELSPDFYAGVLTPSAQRWLRLQGLYKGDSVKPIIGPGLTQ